MSSSSSSAERAASADDFSTAHSATWKQEANHRLAAHRARRGGRADRQNALPGMEDSVSFPAAAHPGETEKSRSIADRVAARYEKAPTYSEMLAAEARNAARAAEAAALAANQARDAAQAILVGLDAHLLEVDREHSAAHAVSPERQVREKSDSHRQGDVSLKPTGLRQADQRQTPPLAAEYEDVHPVQALPAKLLEFPRELVAARKARPRLAEGPLREESDSSQPQLRIFEVEPESISTEPLGAGVISGWSSIRLDTHFVPQQDEASAAHVHNAELQQLAITAPRATEFELPLQTASLEDRLMAGVVDLSLTAAGFFFFIFAFVASTSHLPSGKPLLMGGAMAFLVLAVMYQLLFFCFGHDTPGMRYARIALCTFADGNPSRQARRRRVGALCLSTSPLGLGVLWALFDHDRLGWHDRISATYQRSYR